MAKLNQQDVEAIAGIVIQTYRTMMEQEAREIAQAHGQMLETAAMIEEVAAREELDISTLGEEANKRAYALAVTMAERAVVSAENTLVEIKRMTDRAQIGIAKGGMSDEYGHWCTSSDWKAALERLLESEKVATERLEAERKRLSDLKLESRGLKLITSS